jgi:predicted nucleic acid-binding protein
MPDVPRFYWDACVFLSYVNEDEDRVGDISSLLESAGKDEIEIVTSTVSVVEVAFGAAERKQSALSEEMEAKINKLWEPASPVTLVEFHILIAEAAKGMIRSGVPAGWSLKPMDAVHLATAQRLKVAEFHTYDGPLKKWASRVSYSIKEPSHSAPKLL